MAEETSTTDDTTHPAKLDDVLQPYVVLVPKDYDPSREYPLLVFLHGSASTETDILDHDYGYTEDFIAMAP